MGLSRLDLELITGPQQVLDPAYSREHTSRGHGEQLTLLRMNVRFGTNSPRSESGPPSASPWLGAVS